MSHPAPETFTGSCIAISVMLERRQVQRGPWTFPDWRLIGIAAAQAADELTPRCEQLSGERSQRYLWTGLSLTLHRDAAESYWYNLVGENPSLYVVCGRRGEYELAPLRVTANYDEAAAHMETNTKVLSTPLPPQVYRWLERYVLDNYTPREPRKRQREQWKDLADNR
jgi:hypothetical protein